MSTNPSAFPGVWPVANGGTGATTSAGLQQAASSGFVAADHGLITWTYDLVIPATTTTALPTAGVINLFRVNVRAAATVTNVVLAIGTAGATLTAGQCFAGLYSSAGTLIGTTADQSTNWAGAGVFTTALTGGPFAVPAGFYWVAMLFNGTTGPAPLRSNNFATAFANAGLAVATARYATNSAAQTSLPASITPGSNALAQVTYWAAIS